jgi:hypothetical protein
LAVADRLQELPNGDSDDRADAATQTPPDAADGVLGELLLALHAERTRGNLLELLRALFPAADADADAPPVPRCPNRRTDGAPAHRRIRGCSYVNTLAALRRLRLRCGGATGGADTLAAVISAYIGGLPDGVTPPTTVTETTDDGQATLVWMRSADWKRHAGAIAARYDAAEGAADAPRAPKRPRPVPEQTDSGDDDEIVLLSRPAPDAAAAGVEASNDEPRVGDGDGDGRMARSVDA